MKATRTSDRVSAPWSRLGILAVTAMFSSGIAFAQSPPASSVPPEVESPEPAAPAAPPEPPREDDGIETIYVTGSRIAYKQNRKEGPAAVTVITAEDIQKRSFSTVSDVLYALPQANTAIQTEQDTNNFTANLNPIDLRGLGPGRTLVLVNGRRVPDYPGAYNGESNAVNTGAIPAVAIERVEVLSGGASAIYGSDAVAGVVNIVLKKNYEGLYASARAGTTTQGGGESERLQFGGGKTALDGRFKSVFGVEYLHRKPIYAFDRNRTDSSLDAPTEAGRAAARNYAVIDDFGQSETTYIDPGENGCDAFTGVGLSRQFRDPQGYYCGNSGWNSIQTFRNSDNQIAGYGEASLSYDTEQEIYGFGSFYRNRNRSLYSAPFWYSGADTGTIVDASREDAFGIGGQAVTYQRLFMPGETGSIDDGATRFRESSYEVGTGLRGTLAEDYTYEAYISNARYESRERQRYFVTEDIEDYFLGQPIGEAGDFLEGSGVLIYQPNMDRLNSPLTPAVYRSLTEVAGSKNFSQLQTVNASLSGPAFNLPAGPAKFAVVIEAVRQKYELRPDEGLLPEQSRYWGAGSTGGKGKRDRYAAGVELRAPIVEKLESSLAARYDRYDDITDVNGALTYNAGLEYRPVSSVLLRGSAASSFRAPDMHYVFAGESSYFVVVDDYYKCRKYQDDVPLEECDYSEVNPSGTRTGNADLKEEKGKSYTFGIFWDIAPRISLSIDYYDIKLRNIVSDSSIDSLLKNEADCRLGQTEGGTPVDINSTTCQTAIAQVGRGADNGTEDGETLLTVFTSPINQSYLRTKGIDVAGNAGFGLGAYGGLSFTLAYNNVLSYKTRQYADEPIVDENNTLIDGINDQSTYKTRTSASVSWDIDKWDFTLFATRFGSIPSHRGGSKLSAYVRTNASIAYALTENATITLSGVNVFDKMPPRDEEETTYPYFDIYHYDIVGREIFAQVDVRF